MNISKPFRVTKTAFDPKVHGVQWTESELPTLDTWRKLSNVTLAIRDNDHKLKLIDEFIDTYHKSRRASVERIACLGQLYFLTDYWLKEAEKSTDRVVKARETAMWELFKIVVNVLCQTYQCSVNVLPRVLEETWGRALTEHGAKVDKPLRKGAMPKVATYLNEYQREQYRLRFKGGLAYQLPWWSWWRVSPMLAESKRVGWTYHPAIKEQMMQPDYAGFGLTMGREIYMAHHRGGFANDNFFHSSYASGGAVLCTGTMLIQHGIVRGLSNDSGHYQPSVAHLVNVVQTLQMHGQQPSAIKVTAVKYSWYKGDQPAKDAWIGTGQELLDWFAGGYGVEYLKWAQDTQIGDARLKFEQTTAAKLPNRPPPPPPRR